MNPSFSTDARSDALAAKAIEATDAPFGPGQVLGRLRIHSVHAKQALGWFATLCQSMWRRFQPASALPGALINAKVQVTDLNGVQHFTAQDTERLVELLLPAGIYNVAIEFDASIRRYTVRLDSGTTVNLHVPLSSQ
jgi:hypothetical protein